MKTYRIDLNMLEGNRILTSSEFTVGSPLETAEVDEVVSVIEAEGDTYQAVVERMEGPLIFLRLDLASRSSIPEFLFFGSDGWEAEMEAIESRSDRAA